MTDTRDDTAGTGRPGLAAALRRFGLAALALTVPPILTTALVHREVAMLLPFLIGAALTAPFVLLRAGWGWRVSYGAKPNRRSKAARSSSLACCRQQAC